MARRAARVDANQKALVTSLRGLPGVSVQSLAMVGSGCPDLVVGYRGQNVLIELKDPKKPPSGRLLTSDQKAWHRDWRGQISIATTLDEVLDVIGWGR
jgi:hypothetical protein